MDPGEGEVLDVEILEAEVSVPELADETDEGDEDAGDDAASTTLPVPAAPTALTTPEPSERVDTLTRYMAELAHHPPISREEEHALAVRWVEDGDAEAGRRLALSNLRLVVKIAMEYRRAWTNTLDLVQEGNLGLLQAVQRFDPTVGTRLSSYAAYWIRAYILKYLIDNIRLVKMGGSRAQRKLFFRLNKEKRELERQGFKPTPALIAERLDVSTADVEEIEARLSGSDLSLEAPARRDEDGGASYGDFIPAPGESAEAQVLDDDLRRTFLSQVDAFAETLDDRDRRILNERVLAEPPRTLQELGDDLGLTRERVRQLEKKMVDRLRDYLRENVVDFEYYAPSDD